LQQEDWIAYVRMIQTLLDRFFLHAESAITPPALVSGGDLLRALQLEPGPHIGKLLAAIREAQAAGEVATREEALEFAQRFQSQQDSRNAREGDQDA
jgi:hypothetical protein